MHIYAFLQKDVIWYCIMKITQKLKEFLFTFLLLSLINVHLTQYRVSIKSV